MPASCKVELFGGLRILRGEEAISHFRTRKVASLLAFLAYHRDRAHPREALIDMLWPWADPAAGRHSLSSALSSLRHQLEPTGTPAGAVLAADRASVGLNPETVTTDVAEFEAALLEAGRAVDERTKEEQLEEAACLYRGELLSGLYDPWISPEQVRLSERYAGAVVKLAGLLAERGETTEALSHLRRAIEAEPLREEPYRHLIRLSAELGEPGAAVATYRQLERVLAEELGEKPSATTRKLVKDLEQLATRAPGPGLSTASLGLPPLTRRQRRTELPSGVVTILLVGTDHQGSPDVGQSLQKEFRRHGGVEIGAERSAFAAAFAHAGDALNCAATCQVRVLGDGATDSEPSTRLAMAIHTADLAAGPAGQYPGGSLHRVERLLGAAHPGQILCSEASAGLLRYDLNGGLQLRDLGVYRLRGASALERIFQLDYPGGPETYAPLNAESGHATHLPHQITRLFGRRTEIEQLEEMLADDARLMTLVGPPGCGKTRLAIEAAQQLVESFRGNVWFVPLADLREGGDIIDRALDPLGIQRQPKARPLDQIATSLAEKPSLVVFDNFEHLIESAADVRALLDRLPDLRCLVTSRRRLGLAGEQEFPVMPLPVPDEDSLRELLGNDSAQLFVDRAQAVRPDFQLTAGNSEAVAELCRRLEGIPLAIELAAARSQTHGLLHILEQLARGKDVVTRSRDAEGRHRSLRAAVEWSYSLLSPELQGFFTRLSAFQGGWTLEAAEAVCDDPLASDYLMQLVELSLVQFDPEARPEPRHRMLEMIRQYAAEQLESSGDRASLRDAHFRHFSGLVERFESNREGPDGILWYDRLEADHDNLLAALDYRRHAPDGLDDALNMATRLQVFWEHRGFLTLGRRTIGELLAGGREQDPTVPRMRALNAAAVLASTQGDLECAESYLREKLAGARLLKSAFHEGQALNNLGCVLVDKGDYALARQVLTDALGLARAQGEEYGAAQVLSNLGEIADAQGDYDTAWQASVEFLESCRKHGERVELTVALRNVGNQAVRRKDYSHAKALYEEGLAIARAYRRPEIAPTLCAMGTLAHKMLDTDLAISRYSEALEVARELEDETAISLATLNLSVVYCETGDLEESRNHLLESLRRALRVGRKRTCADGLEQAAILASALANRPACPNPPGVRSHAARLCSASQAIKSSIGARTDEQVTATLTSLRESVDAPTFEAAWAEGLAMTFEQAMAYALEYLKNA